MALLITGLQIFLHFADEFFPTIQTVHDLEQLEDMNLRLDSMMTTRIESGERKIYSFNPNYLNDFKGYLLGMSPDEIDRLTRFRDQGKFIKSAEEFQRVTAVSDSLLVTISPYFRFPPNKNRPANSEMPTEKKDLNKATREDFRKVAGVGETFANRIVAYRNILGGYSLEAQMHEVYNLPEETVQRILKRFEIREKPVIKRLNVNGASFKEILALPYIDYDLTRRIMNFRREEKVITDLNDLKKIDSFPLDKFDRIALYLLAE